MGVMEIAYTALAIASIVNGLQVPSQVSVDESHLQHQQPLAYNDHAKLHDDAFYDHGMNPLTKHSSELHSLFWTLTSNDISNSLNQQHLNLKPHQIVLGNHNTHNPPNPPPKAQNHPATLPISMSTIGGYPIYHAPMALGTPPQPFKAWLNPNLNGLYVRSSKCSKRDCGRGFVYDAEKSESRESLERRFEVQPEGWVVGGNVSTDVLRLVSVDVDGVSVGEVDEYRGEELFWFVLEFVVDGALGLAPPNAETSALSPLTVPNPLYSLVKSKALKHNVLTLTLPSNVDDTGSLQIGPPQKTHKNTLRIPFSNSTHPSLSHTWHIPLTSLTLTGQNPLHLPLQSVHARLDFSPSLGLPSKTANEIYKALNAKQNDLYRGAMIDCDSRRNLPDLVLGFGAGREVVMGWEEYSFEQTAWGYTVCVVGIVPVEGEGVAVLGREVLGKFGVVVDVDAGELGLIPRV